MPLIDPFDTDWPVIEPGSQATPDDPVHCHLCGLATSVAMIAAHLIEEHGFDADEIANAPILVAEEPHPDAPDYGAGEVGDYAP